MCSTSTPIDELKDITESLKKARTETTHVRSEIESMLDELRTLTGREPQNRPNAA
jgi:hypothetical protein